MLENYPESIRTPQSIIFNVEKKIQFVRGAKRTSIWQLAGEVILSLREPWYVFYVQNSSKCKNWLSTKPLNPSHDPKELYHQSNSLYLMIYSLFKNFPPFFKNFLKSSPFMVNECAPLGNVLGDRSSNAVLHSWREVYSLYKASQPG